MFILKGLTHHLAPKGSSECTRPLECFTTEVFLEVKHFDICTGPGKAEEGVLLCKAIVAMASTLQKNLDNNNYTFNDLRKVKSAPMSYRISNSFTIFIKLKCFSLGISSSCSRSLPTQDSRRHVNKIASHWSFLVGQKLFSNKESSLLARNHINKNLGHLMSLVDQKPLSNTDLWAR